MKRILIALPLLLAACQDGKITPAESALTACQSFTAAVNVAASLNSADKLSEKQVGLVDKAIAIADPICSGPAPAIDATAFELVAVEHATGIINTVIGE